MFLMAQAHSVLTDMGSSTKTGWQDSFTRSLWASLVQCTIRITTHSEDGH